MVPTSRTRTWFGWVAQGWNITFFARPTSRAGVNAPGTVGGWSDRTDTLLGPGTTSGFTRHRPNPEAAAVLVLAGVVIGSGLRIV